MKDELGRSVSALVHEEEIHEPHMKVWRAITIVSFRERWLPSAMLANPEATIVVPGREASYRMRNDRPPYEETLVVFQVLPTIAGTTLFRVIHYAERETPSTAISQSPLMLAA